MSCNNASVYSNILYGGIMKKITLFILLASICSCTLFKGDKGNTGTEGAPGESVQGPEGSAGKDGKDGKDANLDDLLFREVGELGVYEEQGDYDGTHTAHLTCMLGESSTANKVVLRIRTAVGGMADVFKIGNSSDLIYLPAGKEIFLTSKKGNGTYKIIIDGVSSTKACSPL